MMPWIDVVKVLSSAAGLAAIVGATAFVTKSNLVKTAHTEMEALIETRGERITDLEKQIADQNERIARLEGQYDALITLKTKEIAEMTALLVVEKLKIDGI